jgi:hypothetical protein
MQIEKYGIEIRINKVDEAGYMALVKFMEKRNESKKEDEHRQVTCLHKFDIKGVESISGVPPRYNGLVIGYGYAVQRGPEKEKEWEKTRSSDLEGLARILAAINPESEPRFR